MEINPNDPRISSHLGHSQVSKGDQASDIDFGQLLADSLDQPSFKDVLKQQSVDVPSVSSVPISPSVQEALSLPESDPRFLRAMFGVVSEQVEKLG